MYSFSEIVKNDTEYRVHNGVYQIIQQPFTDQLQDFLKGYYANAKPHVYAKNYSDLPFIENNSGDWKFRRASLKVMKNILEKGEYKSFLEIGPWNGWLTHHVSQQMEDGVVVDLFVDEANGLGAIKHYKEAKWLPIQCDIENMNFFNISFDLIIFNHCVQFFHDYRKAISNARSLLNKGGTLVILGLPVYKDPSAKQRENENLKRTYLDRTGKNLYFRPSKGYFDDTDKQWLEKHDFKFFEYDIFYRNKFLAYFNKKRPRFYYATYDH